MACATLKRSFDPLTSPQHNSQNKRRRCGAFHGHSPVNSPVASPFAEVTPKPCQDELTQNVHEEWRRLQRRKRLPSPDMSSSPFNNGYQHNDLNQHMSDTNSFINAAHSPHNSNFSTMLLQQLPGSTSPLHNKKEQPLFTVKQVVMLCERLWKEREDKLREEYDKVLNTRLAEQYDSFLKFTQDQIMQRYQQSACSYVS